MEHNKPILGTTLYSFTNEWLQRMYTLDQLIEKVAELKLGPAVEVVGFQSIRGFPDVSDEFVGHFRGLLEKYELIPSCLSANCDVGRRRDRMMSEEELLDYLGRQIASAKKLGFPVMRIQAFVGPKIFEKIAPVAEKAGVQVAGELHSPLAVDHPEVVALRECFDRLGSEFIGFVPDFSCTMTRPPEGYWDDLRLAGASEGLIEAAKEIWLTDKPNPEKFAALAEASARSKENPAVLGRLNGSMTMFAHMPVERMAELLPYTKHIHGKFYEVDASGVETCIPYPALMELLRKQGYRGTISAEWEGHAFNSATVGIQQVQAWNAMCTRLLAN